LYQIIFILSDKYMGIYDYIMVHLDIYYEAYIQNIYFLTFILMGDCNLSHLKLPSYPNNFFIVMMPILI